MIKYIETTETITEKKPVSIVCDICKKEYSFEKDIVETQEFYCARFVGGYGSIFGDGSRIECDICQYCLKKLIGGYCRENENDN